MLDVLTRIENELPELLSDERSWNTLNVDYEPPFVERVWRQVGEYRVNLHRIHPCRPQEALFHPHPWPSAVKILSGRYQQGIGYGPGRTAPPIAATVIVTAGSSYEMVERDGWHFVAPIDDVVLSLLVTGKPWDRWSPQPTKPLSPLSVDAKQDILYLLMQLFPSRR